MCSDQSRTYERNNCIVFLKTKEAFGGLSNMAGGFPLRVNGIRIFTSEALYQACRFPHLPDVQRIVLGEPSPMTSKMKSKPYRKDSRPDWDQVRVRVMRWCLRVKLVQNWKAFGDLLLATDDKPLVEESRKDDFWGANPVDERTLVGMNVLGRLLMELREEFKSDRRDTLLRVEPLQIPDFLLMGQPIPVIEALAQDSKRLMPSTGKDTTSVGQPSLFDQPPLFDAKVVAVPIHEVNEQMPQIYSNSYSEITNLQPYPEYKESGVPWIGVVPREWRIERTKWFFRSAKELNLGRRNKNVLSLTLRGVVNNNPDSPEGMVPKDYATYQIFRKHDLVFKLIDLENIRTSRVGLVHEDGIMSSAYVRLIPAKATNVRFFYLQFFDLYTRAVFNSLGAGVRSTLGPTDLGELRIAIPQPDEQAAIVRFLDHATHRLDKAIRAKRKTIALLNEQKQAIIHRAVTRGLNTDVALKDSCIPWLGLIPAHWEVRRAKYLFREIDQRSVTGDEELLSVSHITGVTPRSEKNITMFKAESYAGHKVCRPGDLVINTMWAWMAALGVSKHTGIISPAYAVYRQREPKQLTDEYVDFLLRAKPYISNYICRSTGVRASRLRLYPEEFFRIPIIIPPITEQESIIIWLRTETREIVTATQRIEREIELLREYRTRLIADVVTGKLDVREAAARLPEVESAPADEPELAEMEESGEELTEENA